MVDMDEPVSLGLFLYIVSKHNELFSEDGSPLLSNIKPKKVKKNVVGEVLNSISISINDTETEKKSATDLYSRKERLEFERNCSS